MKTKVTDDGEKAAEVDISMQKHTVFFKKRINIVDILMSYSASFLLSFIGKCIYCKKI